MKKVIYVVSALLVLCGCAPENNSGLEDGETKQELTEGELFSGLESLKDFSVIEVSFKVSFKEDETEDLVFHLPDGGFITGVMMDSKNVLDPVYGDKGWPVCTSHTVCPGDLTAGEHVLTYTIEGADAETSLEFSGADYAVSGMRVKSIKALERADFRLLLWNIQCGMWADQGNDYDNFVAWLKKIDPDCFAVVEAQTVKKTGGSGAVAAEDKYFPAGWAETAPRYGHPYVDGSGHRDAYPQELTSKTPITTIRKITETSVAGKYVRHGAGHFRVTVCGREIDIVTMHTWPQAYAPGISSDKQEESAAANEGDHYRKFEVEEVMKMTVLNPEFASQKNWIVVGDMNSFSRADSWYYGLDENSTKYIAQDYIRDNTDLIDVIEARYPGKFMNTTAAGTKRIDFAYVSPTLYEAVLNAVVVRDAWTNGVHSGIASQYYPSDHRPILIDFKF